MSQETPRVKTLGIDDAGEAILAGPETGTSGGRNSCIYSFICIENACIAQAFTFRRVVI